MLLVGVEWRERKREGREERMRERERLLSMSSFWLYSLQDVGSIIGKVRLYHRSFLVSILKVTFPLLFLASFTGWYDNKSIQRNCKYIHMISKNRMSALYFFGSLQSGARINISNSTSSERYIYIYIYTRTQIFSSRWSHYPGMLSGTNLALSGWMKPYDW